jgi:hypothetical protein
MNKLLITTALLAATGAANAASLPKFEVTCPGELSVRAAAGGPVHINDKPATLSKFSEHYYEAKGGGVTVSISLKADGSSAISSTGKEGASGACKAGEEGKVEESAAEQQAG